MNWDVAERLKAALDDGCSLCELEATLLAGAGTDDEIAAAWLYVWAYDAIRPSGDDLAFRYGRLPIAPWRKGLRSVAVSARERRPTCRSPTRPRARSRKRRAASR